MENTWYLISRFEILNPRSELPFQDTTEDAALDMAVLVAKFFEHFSQFQGNRFHFAGESYAVNTFMLIPFLAGDKSH